jgi:23S rRNA pseudouridine1911/1915/1917 synthase
VEEQQEQENGLAIVDSDSAGRLDQFLVAFAGLSRSQIKKMIEGGFVKVNGQVQRKAGYAVNEDDQVTWDTGSVSKADNGPKHTVPLDIVFEDSHLIVINKPRNLVVHPGAGTRGLPTVSDSLAAYLASKGEAMTGYDPGEARAGIVHRLDKDTTGLLVCAKSKAVHENLSAQFRDKTNLREYVALLWGVMREDVCEVESYLSRDPKFRTRFTWTSVQEYGKMAEAGKDLSGYRWAKSTFSRQTVYGNALTLARVRLATGRTHQIRVHAKQLGLPVVGDKTYPAQVSLPGDFPADLRSFLAHLARHMLHAHVLGFTHPVTQKKIAFKASLPADFTEVLDRLNQRFEPKELSPDIKR